MQHVWEICDGCGPFVRCGYCGNNCCNGGSGENCDCKEAYLEQDKGAPEPLWKEWLETKDSRRANYEDSLDRLLGVDK